MDTKIVVPIAIGALVALSALIILVMFLCFRKYKKSKDSKKTPPVVRIHKKEKQDKQKLSSNNNTQQNKNEQTGEYEVVEINENDTNDTDNNNIGNGEVVDGLAKTYQYEEITLEQFTPPSSKTLVDSESEQNASANSGLITCEEDLSSPTSQNGAKTDSSVPVLSDKHSNVYVESYPMEENSIYVSSDDVMVKQEKTMLHYKTESGDIYAGISKSQKRVNDERPVLVE